MECVGHFCQELRISGDPLLELSEALSLRRVLLEHYEGLRPARECILEDGRSNIWGAYGINVHIRQRDGHAM